MNLWAALLGTLIAAGAFGVWLDRPDEQPDDRERAQQRMRKWLDERERGGGE